MMQHDGITLRDLPEHVARAPLRIHEILGYRLEPVDGGPMGKDVGEVDVAQSEAEPEPRERIEALRHSFRRR
jgi:hypothetical protein